MKIIECESNEKCRSIFGCIFSVSLLNVCMSGCVCVCVCVDFEVGGVIETEPFSNSTIYKPEYL